MVAGGGNAEYVTVHEGHVMPVPAGLTLLDAAAIPEVWLTAYQLLHFVGECELCCCCECCSYEQLVASGLCPWTRKWITLRLLIVQSN